MNKTLGLSMIVKDEAHVIERLLLSVYPIIDYWVIVDTGSTDGTQEKIINFFNEKGIPGELKEIEWKDDFSYARNIALNAIEEKTDYGFWIDADEQLVVESNFNKQNLFSSGFKSYSVKTVYGQVDYTRKNIWKTGENFNWAGPIHELLSSNQNIEEGYAENLYVIVKPEGNSWKNITAKYSKHAEILKAYTEINNDPRWIFYTAQSYRDSGQHIEAINWYTKRSLIKDTGYIEEVFISKFMIAKISEAIGKSKQECTKLYQEAHAEDPARGESIAALIKMYHRQNDWQNAYVYSLYGLKYHRKNPYPHRILFLDKHVYNYEMLELHALSCYNTKQYEEGSNCFWAMKKCIDELGTGYLSAEKMQVIEDNKKYFPPVFPSMNNIANTMPQRKGSNYTPPKKKRK